jgi:hypothetical protein
MITSVVMHWGFTGGGTEVEVSEGRGLREEEETAASKFDLSGRGLHSPTRAVVLQVEEHHLSEPKISSLIIDGSDNRGDEDLEQKGHFKLDFIPHQGFQEYPSPSQIGEDLVNGSNVTSFYTQQEIQEDTLDEEAEAICMKSMNHLLRLWLPALRLLLAYLALFFLLPSNKFVWLLTIMMFDLQPEMAMLEAGAHSLSTCLRPMKGFGREVTLTIESPTILR